MAKTTTTIPKASLGLLLLAASAAAFTDSKTIRQAKVQLKETKDDLKALAVKLNPRVRFYDPFDVAGMSPWGFTAEQNIGWLRHSEIKHGRVAMAAFVGYVVQSNYHFPWKMTLAGDMYPSTDLSPPEQWDALPDLAKYQIIAFIGFLEFYSELTPNEDSKSALPHYVNGGIPGKFPAFDDLPHPVPFNLYDPFGLSKKRSPEAKARGLVSEINNGRLAMIGIFGFLAEQTIPGSVPLLTGVVKPYSGEVMAPF